MRQNTILQITVPILCGQLIFSILSGFLKTIEKHGAYLGLLPLIENEEKDFDANDFRKKIKSRDANVIHVNLNNIKPKGNG